MWVNLPKLCMRFLNPKTESLGRVYLFTALNNNLAQEPQICRGLLDFQRSLGVEVVEGYFGKLKIRDKLGVKKYFLKEKESDVSLGIKIAEDSILGLCDKVMLISNDGDFIPALKLSKKYGVDVEVVTPPVVSVNKRLIKSISQETIRQISEQDLEISVIARA